jgi:predicted nucleic acid-binding protein
VNYLIDTNIISEIRKGSRCDPNLAAWYASIDDGAIYLSALVFGEIRKGIEKARPRDPAQAQALENWLSAVQKAFAERVLPVDQLVAEEWGRMTAARSVPSIDALLAATAKVHRMTLVTRNLSDVSGLGADVLNPFEPTGRS